MNVFVTVVLETDRDRDILHRLAGEPKGSRAEVIRQALRDHYGKQGVTLDDVYQLLVELRRMGVTASASLSVDVPAGPEDQDLADALDELGAT